jgi:hypothetical protein
VDGRTGRGSRCRRRDRPRPVPGRGSRPGTDPDRLLYPLITDGLALVAYAATSRLHDGARRYAAGIVVLAAGLSGLAQAIYLAGGIATSSVAPVGLRFGVGAWPAVAAALTAHLLHLIGTAAPAADHAEPLTPTSLLHKPDPALALADSEHPGEEDLVDRRPIGPQSSSESFTLGAQPELTPFVQQAPTRQQPSSDSASNPAGVQPFNPPGVQPYNPSAVQPPRADDALNATAVQPERSTPGPTTLTADASPSRSESSGVAGPASERARQAARAHYTRHGRLPTATELMQLAQVARGTAGTVLKDLRRDRPALHLVNADTEPRADQ